MCFRRIMAIEDADRPLQVAKIAAGSVAPGVPRQNLWLDPNVPIAIPNMDAPLHRMSAVSILTSGTSAPVWVNVQVDGADRIVVENLAVGVVRLSSLMQPEAGNPPTSTSETARSAPSGEPPLKVWNGSDDLSLIEAELDGSHTILRFALPPRSTIIKVTSPSVQPPGDGRRLGVAIFRLQVDGVDIALDGPSLTRGFHRAESGEGMSWRWTDGDSIIILPAKSSVRTLSIHITDWHSLLWSA